MGEVWCATDTNLGRQVAIKILPDAFAHDPERLARFEREAKTLASLNHPNIAMIHGLEKADGIRGLVMELVEGPTLADRIAQGSIPIDEALPIAKQIITTIDAHPRPRLIALAFVGCCALLRCASIQRALRGRHLQHRRRAHCGPVIR